MGQYLAIGLTYKISTSLNEMKKEKIFKEELRQGLEHDLLFDMNLYDETETDKRLLFTLNNQQLEKGLIPFLEAFYPVAYGKQNEKEYEAVLKKLHATPSTQWLELAEEKSYCSFQYDPYAESDYIRFSKPFHPSIRIDFDCIMLTTGHGKIVTEGIGNLMDIFKYCTIETFKEHPIVKSIQIYITG